MFSSLESLELNLPKSHSDVIQSSLSRNTIVLCPFDNDQYVEFKSKFEIDFFKFSSHPILILVDRPNIISEYYHLLTKKFSIFVEEEVQMLDGLINLDEVKDDWKNCLDKKIIITSCVTALNVFVHAFISITFFQTIYVPTIPSTKTNHPFCKIMKLLYDPISVGSKTKIIGLLQATETWTEQKMIDKKDDGTIVFALNEWNTRIKSYVNELHCHVVNVVPTLPFPQLSPSYSNDNENTSFKFDWNLVKENNQVKWLSSNIKDSKNDHILTFVEDENIKDALIDFLQKHFVLNNSKRRVFSGDTLSMSNIKNCSSTIIICSFNHSYLIDSNLIDEIYIHFKDTTYLKIAAQSFIKKNLRSRPCHVSAVIENGGSKILARLKSLISFLVNYKENLVSNPKTGSVLHPMVAVDLLVRFCSYLPKVSPSGKLLKGLQVVTVPVRRLNEDENIIPELNDVFATKIILPERLSNWFGSNDSIIGDSASSRSEAQSLAAFKAFKKLIDFGLVDENLLAISDIRFYQKTKEDIQEEVDIVADEFSHKTNVPSDFDHFIDDSETKLGSKMGSLNITEVIPEAMTLSSHPFEQELFLYVIEYELESINSIPNFPQWTKKLLTNGGDFLNTKKGGRCFGVLIPNLLPLNLPSIQVPLGSEHYLTANLVRVSYTQSRELFEKIIAIQFFLFSLLSTRPISAVDESATEIRSFDSLQLVSCYFVVPLIKSIYKPIPSMSFEGGEWKIDMKLIDDLFFKNNKPLTDILNKHKTDNDEEKNNSLDKDEQLNLYLSQLILEAPYSGMYYKFRKMYDNLNPSSAFGVKNMPDVKCYFDFIKQKYFPNDEQFSADMEQPLVGVGRVENFADLSQWIIDDAVGSSEIQVKKRKKNEEAGNKSALITSLIQVTSLPYWLTRTLLVIPKVMFELERQLQALEFYQKPIRMDTMPPIDLCIKSLSAVTANLPYNYERLEVLGDSLLKVAVSMDLITSEERLGEGRLSQKRQAKISNFNLYRIGVSLDIHKYAALTPFSHKLWTPPGIECLIRKVFETNDTLIKYLNQLNETAKELQTKIIKVLFDPELKWRLLKNLDEKTINREDTWTLTHDGNLIPPIRKETNNNNDSNKTCNNSSNGITRYGMSVPSKFIADLIEASVGAFYQGCGMEVALRYLIKLGLLSPQVTKASQIPKIKVLGNLVGDPRDIFPIEVRSEKNIMNNKKNRKTSKKIDWSNTIGKKQSDTLVVTLDDREEENEEESIKTLSRIFAFEAIHQKEPDMSGFEFEEIEKILGYQFEEKKLLYTAFTHVTKDPFFCNERLEWFGDAILDWVVTCYYYNGDGKHRDMNPHELSEARKSAVNNISFSEIASYYNLDKYLMADNVSLMLDIEKFNKSLRIKYEGYSNISDPKIYWELCQQDPIPPKSLGDLWEAVAGAIFIDLGLDFDKFTFVITPLLEPFLKRHLDPDALRTNPISLCLESWSRLGIYRSDIIFEEVLSDGEKDHLFKVKVKKTLVGEGRALNRFLAKQIAASSAVEYLTLNPVRVQEIIKEKQSHQ